MAKGQRTPLETKLSILKRMEAGEKESDLAKELGVHATTISDWKKQLANHKPKRKVATVKTRRGNPLKEENTNLKKEVEFWKDAYMTEYRKNALLSR